MEERHIIAVYCRFNNDMKDLSPDYTFPRHVLNRIKKAMETYARLADSHADDEFIKILLYGTKLAELLKKYAASLGLPEERMEVDYCNNIEDMVRKLWNRVKNNAEPPRVYFVLSGWQWVFIEPLLAIKDERFKFFFEAALDERRIDEIDFDRRMEKVARIEIKESRLTSILDKLGSNVSENMKG
jgi:hypothetical protein